MFAVKVGQKFKVGNIDFTIKKARKPWFSSSAMDITFEANQDAAEMAKIFRLEDKSQWLIKSKSGGQSQKRYPSGQISTRFTRTLPKKIDQCSLAVRMWNDPRSLKVPFDSRLSIKTRRSRPFAMKVGKKIEVGDIELIVKRTRSGLTGDMPQLITLECKRDLSGIAAVQFEDQHGKQIESRRARSSPWRHGKDLTTQATYLLAKEIEKGVLLLQTCEDPR
jgi:hypothetical protein